MLLSAAMAVNSAVLQLVAAVSSLTFVLVTGFEALLGLGPAIFLTSSALSALPLGRAMDRAFWHPELGGYRLEAHLSDQYAPYAAWMSEALLDLYAADGTAYLVEVKSHVKPGDVLTFHRKTQFAAQTLERPFTPLIIALSMEAQAERLMQTLGIQYRVRTRVE